MSAASTSGKLLVGRLNNRTWVRVVGKGSHQLAPALKKWVQREIQLSVDSIVLDLVDCISMDSTFLGTIAKLSIVSQAEGIAFELLRGNEHVLRILSRMGIDQLATVHSGLGSFSDEEPSLSQAYQEHLEQNQLSKLERLQFTLEAHQQLSQVSEENRLRFADVIELLEQELNQEGS